MISCRIIIFTIVIFSMAISATASPIGQTTIIPDADDATETYEIIFRVESSDNKSDGIIHDSKLTALPAEEVKAPVKDSIVVFRQEEEEVEEDETEEEEVEEEPELPAEISSTTAAPEASPSTPTQELGPVVPSFSKSPEVISSTRAPVTLENVVSTSEVPDEPNLGNFEGLLPGVPASSVSELDETEVDDPSPPPPPVPSVQPVQTGDLPILEPGVFTPRPKTTEPPPRPSARPEPFEPENTPGIPVEENPGSVVVKEGPLKPLTPEPPKIEKIAVLPPPEGKYKITKPKIPVLPPKVPLPSPSEPPKSISEEWNFTSSIFTLSPQGRAACECGKTPFKVDNADKSGINEYPWTVAVVRSGIFSSGRPHCGGVLINNAYILSSASCFESLLADNVQIWLTAHSSLQAIDNTIHSDRILKRDVREILMHPNYDRSTHDNDIALVKLSYPVDISTSSYYVPACLPAGMGSYDGMNARVLSWISTGANRFIATNMCKQDIQVISNQVCNRDSSHRNKVTGNQMCAGSLAKQPTESCINDAGGPLMLPNNGRFTLIGLVSHGFTNRQAYTPVVYTRVGTYADWILHNTDDAEWCSL